MVQSAYKIMKPGAKSIFKYTTVSGVTGFDGVKKEPEKAVSKKVG